jgi:pimeloyl-ACP methyl ester carboxylesterase
MMSTPFSGPPGLPLNTANEYAAGLRAFAGRTIDVPSCFIGGASDWGVRQSPGAFEEMQQGACIRLLSVHLVDGAGCPASESASSVQSATASHSLAEEQPGAVNRLLIEFLRKAA